MLSAARRGRRPARASSAPRVVTRDATAWDNPALLELAAACPMEGDIGLCMTRAPDFFGLSRLEGEDIRVRVAEGLDGSAAGCIAIARRAVHLDGAERDIAYVGDFKVHPAHRGGLVGDALTVDARDAARAFVGESGPAVMTILAGNAAMEHRAAGPRGLPRLARFATVCVHAVPVLWSRTTHRASVTITRARWGDLDEMVALWRRVAPSRQLAPVLTSDSLPAFIASAPGLDIDSYLLARERDTGRLRGFLALWDQRPIKQLRVTRYSARLAAFRLAFNALAPALGGTPLPGPGGALRTAATLHVCVSGDDPACLRALVRDAHDVLRGQGYAFFTVALDERDPLSRALDGLLAQPTRIHACVTSARGTWRGPPLDCRPLHLETALV